MGVRPPPGYLGQLDPEFQARLEQRFATVPLEQCYWYHCVLLPDGTFIQGVWDLVENEDKYLGGIDLTDKRVLEVGPASGWITLYMVQQRAEVVVLDIGWDLAPDLLPYRGIDLSAMRQEQREFCARVVNSWWYLRRRWGHSARAVYAPIYDLPGDLGRYDVSVFGSILLHLRDPFLALQQAASLTDETIVVVEPLSVPHEERDRRVMYWNPTQGDNPNGWWQISPATIRDMLSVLGFEDSTITYNRQVYRAPEFPDADAGEGINFTIVAHRP